MRAAENRRWILRATNDGITAMIDPAGRVVYRMPPYKEMSSEVSYRDLTNLTFYTKYGDWFAWMCLICALAAAAIEIWKMMPRKKNAL